MIRKRKLVLMVVLACLCAVHGKVVRLDDISVTGLYDELPGYIQVIKARDKKEINDLLKDFRYKKFHNAYVSNGMCINNLNTKFRGAPGFAIYIPAGSKIAHLYIGDLQKIKKGSPISQPNDSNNLYKYSDCTDTERQLLITALLSNKLVPGATLEKKDENDNIDSLARGKLIIYTNSSPCVLKSKKK